MRNYATRNDPVLNNLFYLCVSYLIEKILQKTGNSDLWLYNEKLKIFTVATKNTCMYNSFISLCYQMVRNLVYLNLIN